MTVGALKRKVLSGTVLEIAGQPSTNQSRDLFYTTTMALPLRPLMGEGGEEM